MRAQVLPVLVGAVVVLLGCGRQAPSTPVSSDAPTSPEPTAIPTAPADGLERTATLDHDGVRLTIELDRNPMPAGEPTWATTTVENIGPDDLVWFHDGCAVSIHVGGTVVGARWRPGVGGQTGIAAEYRSAALERLIPADRSVRIDFTPESRVGKHGSYGCADIGISETIAPGAGIEQRAQWGGAAGQLLGPPPGGLVELVGTFQYYWRESTGEPEDMTTGQLALRLKAWIDQGGPVGLHPAEAIDLALTDGRLVDVIRTRELRNGNEPIVRYDPSSATWAVGLLDYTEPPVVHLVVVDSVTGTAVDWVERTWVYDVDGFP